LRLAAVLAGTGAVCLATAGCGASRADPVTSTGGRVTLEQARAFEDFPLLYAGEQVDGLPLATIVRRNDTASYVSFVYGDCEPGAPDQGCAPPAEVQVWPTCARSLDLYRGGSGSAAVEHVTVRGVQAIALDGGAQLELETGRATVVVFARTPALAARVVLELRPVGAGGARGPLAAAVEEPC
jgi:hypothetical protein